MNANEMIDALTSAIVRGDSAAFDNANAAYIAWRKAADDAGAALPDILQSIADDVRDEAAQYSPLTGRPEIDKARENESFDFRIYIRPDGQIECAIGDPCYDTDHRGEIGAASVSPLNATAADVRAAVLAAFDEALDSAAITLEAAQFDAPVISCDRRHDGGEWREVSRRAATGADLRKLYFMLVSYAQETPIGAYSERYRVRDERGTETIVTFRDSDAMAELADLARRHGAKI